MSRRRGDERGFLVRLTLPTLGLSLAVTLVTTYLPLTIRRYTDSATLIGFAIGGEGLFALAIPLIVGSVSDRTWNRWGRRRPFMIASAPLMAVAVALAPFQPGYFQIAASVFVFFAAYHFYIAPYQALIPDLVPYSRHGQAQGFQTFMRGIGMFVAMVMAGLLLGEWEPLPYMLAGGLLLALTAVAIVSIHEEPPIEPVSPRVGLRATVVELWTSSRGEKPIHRLLVANYLWESTVQGLRPFIMLFFLYALGVQARGGALLIGWVGLTYILGGVVSGYLADRYGRFRVMWGGIVVYMVGCVLGFFLRDIRWVVVLLPIFGAGGAAVLTLPYTIMMALMPAGRLGQFTGLYSFSRGLATVTAPLIVGAAIDIFARWLPESRGYGIIWLAAAAALALSMVIFRTVPRPNEGDAVRTWRVDMPLEPPAGGV